MKRRLARRRKHQVLKSGFPQVVVRGLILYGGDGPVDIDFAFDTTFVPARRLKEFPLGRKFKLIPMAE
jgi:hypothetical protein